MEDYDNEDDDPCVRTEPVKFEATNQNAASGKNCAILTSRTMRSLIG